MDAVSSKQTYSKSLKVFRLLSKIWIEDLNSRRDILAFHLPLWLNPKIPVLRVMLTEADFSQIFTQDSLKLLKHIFE